jgi:transcriptional regulator with XRE-family HTH domain
MSCCYSLFSSSSLTNVYYVNKLFYSKIELMTPEEKYQQFGLPLKQFIKAKSNTLKKFCKIYGYKTSTLSAIIRGNRNPTAKFIWEMERLGFENKGYDVFLNIANVEVTNDDYKQLISHYRSVMMHKDIIIEHLQNRLQATIRDLECETRKRRELQKIHK